MENKVIETRMTENKLYKNKDEKVNFRKLSSRKEIDHYQKGPLNNRNSYFGGGIS